MTAKEKIRMRKLEIENQALRDKLEHHFNVYANQLHEIIDLKAKVELMHFVLDDQSTDPE